MKLCYKHNLCEIFHVEGLRISVDMSINESVFIYSCIKILIIFFIHFSIGNIALTATIDIPFYQTDFQN